MIKDFIHYYKPYKKLFLLDFTCAVIVAILELAFPVMVRSVIDKIVPSQNLQQILLVGAGLLALYAFSTTLNFIVVYMGHILGINIETDMRRELFAKVQKQSFSFFDNMKIGELMSRLSSDLFDISELAHHGPEEFFIAIMTLIASFFLMYQVHPTLALLTIFFVPIIAVALAVFNRRMSRINRNIYKGLANYTAGLENVLSGMRVVKAFANENHEQQLFEELIQEYRSNKIAFYRTMGTSSSFNYLLMRSINLFSLIVGAYFTVIGDLTAGELVGYILLANVFVGPINKMNSMIELYPKGFAGFRRFKELMNVEIDIEDAPDAIPAPPFEGRVEYKNVGFGYEEDKKVLEHINLTVEPGQTVAFVGPSGVGKSSLINFLQSERVLKTGEISERLQRGKHTTRDSNMIRMKAGGYIIDTPGFSSIEVPKIENREELISLFPEFTNIDSCKFLNCSHIHEPNCNVKKAVEENRISQDRYNFYKKTLEILSERWNRYE